jgi:hypothetical protein
LKTVSAHDMAIVLAENADLREVLQAWRAWEAELIEADEAWRAGDGLPRIPQDLYDRYIGELQPMREKALKPLKPPSDKDKAHGN